MRQVYSYNYLDNEKRGKKKKKAVKKEERKGKKKKQNRIIEVIVWQELNPTAHSGHWGIRCLIRTRPSSVLRGAGRLESDPNKIRVTLYGLS